MSNPGPYVTLPRLNQLIQKPPKAAIWNVVLLILRAVIKTFASNLTESAKHCRRPLTPTTAGPVRRCIKANILRSQAVNIITCKKMVNKISHKTMK